MPCTFDSCCIPWPVSRKYIFVSTSVSGLACRTAIPVENIATYIRTTEVLYPSRAGQAGGGSFSRKEKYIAKKEFAYMPQRNKPQ